MSYADIQLLNCNRSASVEGMAGRTDDTGRFTNPLMQSVTLDVGDEVSVDHAFVNEVGAGGAQPIEFQGGTSLKGQRTLYYTRTEYLDQIHDMTSPYYRPGYATRIKTTLAPLTYEMKDNEANITYGYYINTCEHPEYITLPRRFVQKTYFDGTQNTVFAAVAFAGRKDQGRWMTDERIQQNYTAAPSTSTGLTEQVEVDDCATSSRLYRTAPALITQTVTDGFFSPKKFIILMFVRT